MLTSSHYLLGGFFAAFCATGALIQTSHSAAAPSSEAFFGSIPHVTTDIAYRGSGRLEEAPIPKKIKYGTFPTGKHIVAHRGSGRIRPSSI